MGEHLGDHGGIVDGGDDLRGSAVLRTLLDADVEYPFEQPSSGGLASTDGVCHRGRLRRLFALGGALARDALGSAPRVGREHALGGASPMKRHPWRKLVRQDV